MNALIDKIKLLELSTANNLMNSYKKNLAIPNFWEAIKDSVCIQRMIDEGLRLGKYEGSEDNNRGFFEYNVKFQFIYSIYKNVFQESDCEELARWILKNKITPDDSIFTGLLLLTEHSNLNPLNFLTDNMDLIDECSINDFYQWLYEYEPIANEEDYLLWFSLIKSKKSNLDTVNEKIKEKFFSKLYSLYENSTLSKNFQIECFECITLFKPTTQ